jgi:bifunctional non-homologous end joining protein LigD
MNDYRTKRLLPTPEPFADRGLERRVSHWGLSEACLKELGVFVVHLHHARNEHYDLRLSAGDGLLSFAVPRGPSLFLEDKRLAVQTETHPLSYLDFEDMIPDGSYGAGAMIVWDRGTVTPLGPPLERQRHTDKIDFVLQGFKLQGRFSLVRLRERPNARTRPQAQWLLLKKRDGFERARGSPSVLVEAPRSVLSGRTVFELADVHRRKNSATKIEVGSDAPLAVGNAPVVSSPSLAFAAIPGARVRIEKVGAVIRFWSEGEDVTSFFPEFAKPVQLLPWERCVVHACFAFVRPSADFDETWRARIESITRGDARFVGPLAMVAYLFAVDDTGTSHALDRLPQQGLCRAMPLFEPSNEAAWRFREEHGVPGYFLFEPTSGSLQFVWERGEPTAPLRFRTYTVDQDHERSPKSVDGSQLEEKRRLHAAPRLTNRQKVFFPRLGFTKGDVIDHYLMVADRILPFLRGRPVLLTRYPDGVRGKSFFQWNVPPHYQGATLEMQSEDEQGKPKHHRSGARWRCQPRLHRFARAPVPFIGATLVRVRGTRY